MECLLDVGADTETTDDEEGQTPLLRASSMGHSAVAALLLDHGADVLVFDMEVIQLYPHRHSHT